MRWRNRKRGPGWPFGWLQRSVPRPRRAQCGEFLEFLGRAFGFHQHSRQQDRAGDPSAGQVVSRWNFGQVGPNQTAAAPEGSHCGAVGRGVDPCRFGREPVGAAVLPSGSAVQGSAASRAEATRGAGSPATARTHWQAHQTASRLGKTWATNRKASAASCYSSRRPRNAPAATPSAGKAKASSLSAAFRRISMVERVATLERASTFIEPTSTISTCFFDYPKNILTNSGYAIGPAGRVKHAESESRMACFTSPARGRTPPTA